MGIAIQTWNVLFNLSNLNIDKILNYWRTLIFNTCISIVAKKPLEAILKIIMSVQWVYMYYIIIEYEG